MMETLAIYFSFLVLESESSIKFNGVFVTASLGQRTQRPLLTW